MTMTIDKPPTINTTPTAEEVRPSSNPTGPDHNAALAACANHGERVAYACAQQSPGFRTADVQAWLRGQGWESLARQRSTVSTNANIWRKARNLADTTDHEGMPAAIAARIEAERSVGVATPEPDTNVDTETVLEPVTVDSVSDVMTPPAVDADTETDASTPTPLPAPTEPESTPARPVAGHCTSPVCCGVTEGVETASEDTDAESEPAKPATRTGRVWSWFVARFIWIQYVGLLSAAAYGLYEVLDEVAGAPPVTAAVGAIAIELVGISTKLLADRAERKRESHAIVRALLIVSGLVAVGIAITNAWGHAQISVPNGNEYIAAALYGTASVAGYGLWTITTSLDHRARLRDKRQLEGPGLRIPAYLRDRHGATAADRAQKISRVYGHLDIHQAFDQALIELAEEAKEKRESARLEALRTGLMAQSHATHSNKLAANLSASRYSVDQLADKLEADDDGHTSKAADLIGWMASFEQTKPTN